MEAANWRTPSPVLASVPRVFSPQATIWGIKPFKDSPIFSERASQFSYNQFPITGQSATDAVGGVICKSPACILPAKNFTPSTSWFTSHILGNTNMESATTVSKMELSLFLFPSKLRKR